jgi:hypothetical protein
MIREQLSLGLGTAAFESGKEQPVAWNLLTRQVCRNLQAILCNTITGYIKGTANWAFNLLSQSTGDEELPARSGLSDWVTL